MKAYVKQESILCYGFIIKAWVKLHEKQKWDVIGKRLTTDYPLPIWRIKRKSIYLDIFDDDFKQFFNLEGEE